MNTHSNIRSFLGAIALLFVALFAVNVATASVKTIDVTPETSLEVGFVETTAAINDKAIKSVICRGDPEMDAAIDAAFAAGAITYAQWYAYHTYGEIPNMGPQEPPR